MLSIFLMLYSQTVNTSLPITVVVVHVDSLFTYKEYNVNPDMPNIKTINNTVNHLLSNMCDTSFAVFYEYF